MTKFREYTRFTINILPYCCTFFHSLNEYTDCCMNYYMEDKKKIRGSFFYTHARRVRDVHILPHKNDQIREDGTFIKRRIIFFRKKLLNKSILKLSRIAHLFLHEWPQSSLFPHGDWQVGTSFWVLPQVVWLWWPQLNLNLILLCIV